MSDISNADTRRRFTVDPPPHQTPKDMQGSDNTIPLSPQWLVPKAVENKELGPYHDNKPDAIKAFGTVDDLTSTGKRKDVFRPMLYDSEAGRRDRWHDEERETNSAIRRDRWREGDKDSGEARKMERWYENTSRHIGEARRAPSERWNESGNKDTELRRESKWNTRWGPGDKESDGWREKWLDSSKGGNVTPDKGVSYSTSHGKDIKNHGKDTEGEDNYSRSWRSNYILGRGRGDSSHSPTNIKPLNMHGFSRGRSENGISSMSSGRGKFSISNTNNDVSRTHYMGSSHDKSEDMPGDVSSLRYTRMKMLDIYRRTDIKNIRQLIDEFIEVPSLTQVEAVEPLAFSAPTSDESVIIKGIDKGDIVSSGAPQLLKESSTGRATQDLSVRQSKLGSKHDLLTAGDNYNDDNIGNSINMDVTLHNADGLIPKEITGLEVLSHYVPQRSHSSGDHNRHGSFDDRKGFSSEVGLSEYMRSSQLQKDMDLKHSTAITSSFYRDDSYWHNSEGIKTHSDPKTDAYILRQSSEVMKETDPFIPKDMLAAKKLQSPSPEDLSLFYKDPQGQIQGPFSGSDLIGWFEAGYFGIDLQVRLASYPADAPFSTLGDVMPHLRAKAGPPPGFGMAKLGATTDESLRGRFATPSIQTGPGEYNIHMSGQRNMNGAATEVQNQFLESLMSGNMSGSSAENFSSSRGMQEFGGISSGCAPAVVGETGTDVNYLVAQARLLERQRSLQSSHSFWSSGDVSPMTLKTDMVLDSSVPQSKLLPSAPDSTNQILQPPQQVDLLSLLHAGADKSLTRSVSSAPSFHPNFHDTPTATNPIHGGVEFPPEGLHMHYSQNVPSQIRLGGQQQGLQPPSQSPLPTLIPQHNDLSCLVPPDKFLPSEVNQDPRLSNLLQQHYLLSQLQLHSQIPASQLPLLEKFLLLQQQQKQEQQLLLLQQQQRVLPTAVSSHQSHQQFVGPFVPAAAMPAGNESIDNLILKRGNESLQINQQRPVGYESTGQPSYFSNVNNFPGPMDLSAVRSAPLPVHLPHQMFDQTVYSKEPDTLFIMDNDVTLGSGTETRPVMADGLTLSKAMEKSVEVTSNLQKISQSLGEVEASSKAPPSISQAQEIVAPLGSEVLNHVEFVEDSKKADDFVTSISTQLNDINLSSEDLSGQNHTELTSNSDVIAETQVKRASEKKSKKQKKSKAKLVLDTGKGLHKTVPNLKSGTDIEIVSANANDVESIVRTDATDSQCEHSFEKDEMSITFSTESSESQRLHQSSTVDLVTSGSKAEGDVEVSIVDNLVSTTKTSSTQCAWKSATGLKPKSLLEIQQEEQMRAQRETLPPEVVSTAAAAKYPSPAPWSGVVTNLESKSNVDAILEEGTVPANSKDTLKASRKIHLHDLLAEEVLAKSNKNKEDAESSVNNIQSLLSPPPSSVAPLADIASVDDNDFVEAKDTRKARKKASKSKASGAKLSQAAPSAELSASPSPIEKAKSARQAQEIESFPAPSSGPSLGDFVLWKGDLSSPAPPPAWSVDSKKVQRPTSLRDIQMEQEKRSGTTQQVPIPTPVKVQQNHATRGSGTSWQPSGSSPSTAVPSVQLTSQASVQPKSRADDDLFWGPLEQSKPEPKKSDFPPTVSSVSRGIKGSALKGAASSVGAGQKSLGGKPLSSSPKPGLSVPKGRKDFATKNIDAMDFRNWCLNEWFRLTGNNDTSFLEFCIKQSISEARSLLTVNLGSLDGNHEFTDKFLDYMELLSSDVLDLAFQLPKPHNTFVENTNSAAVAVADADEGAEDGLDGQSKGRGKRKGKKGLKVSPALLGFNVVSNRIMMGEIQNVEE